MAKNAAQLLYGPVIVTILFYFHFNVIILGIFYYLQANWYKAEQYCRYHGMHLASINTTEEQRNLEEHIQSFGELRFGYSLLISGGNLSSCFGFGFVSGGRDKEGVGRCGQHCLDIGV